MPTITTRITIPHDRYVNVSYMEANVAVFLFTGGLVRLHATSEEEEPDPNTEDYWHGGGGQSKSASRVTTSLAAALHDIPTSTTLWARGDGEDTPAVVVRGDGKMGGIATTQPTT